MFSGCDGGSDGKNGLSDISYQNASLFREDNRLYEKLQNSGRAEFTAGHEVATDKIRFKIYDVMRYYDRHDILKNEMNDFMTHTGPNHIFFAWCHSNHPRSGVNEFMTFFQNNRTSPAQFKCPICFKIMSSRKSLLRHVKEHSGEKPFACHSCDYRSNQSNNLNLHIRKQHNHVN